MQKMESGQTGNRRIKGRTRRQALAILDEMMQKCGNRRKRFAVMLEAEFNKDPVKFFCEIVIPLIPRHAIDCPDTEIHDHSEVVAWRSAENVKGGRQ
jgi:hypothetical protein